MTKNDIIRMARQAGLQPYYDEQEPAIEAFANLVAAHKAEVALAEAYRCGYEAGAVAERERIIAKNVPEIEKINTHIKALEEAVLAERAECAKLADKQLKNTAALMSNPPKSSAAWEIAIAIRARGTT